MFPLIPYFCFRQLELTHWNGPGLVVAYNEVDGVIFPTHGYNADSEAGVISQLASVISIPSEG